MQRSSSLISMASGGIKPDELPMYNPESDMAKKEASKAKFAERMVHVIPLVIFLSAILLWVFSYPDIGKVVKGKLLIASIKKSTTG